MYQSDTLSLCHLFFSFLTSLFLCPLPSSRVVMCKEWRVLDIRPNALRYFKHITFCYGNNTSQNFKPDSCLCQHILFLHGYGRFFLIMVGWNAEQVSPESPFLWTECFSDGKDGKALSSSLGSVKWTVGPWGMLGRGRQGSTVCLILLFLLVMVPSTLLEAFAASGFHSAWRCYGKCYHKL